MVQYTRLRCVSCKAESRAIVMCDNVGTEKPREPSLGPDSFIKNQKQHGQSDLLSNGTENRYIQCVVVVVCGYIWTELPTAAAANAPKSPSHSTDSTRSTTYVSDSLKSAHITVQSNGSTSHSTEKQSRKAQREESSTM